MTKPLGQLSQDEKADKKESKVIWSKKEKEESKEKYGCEILIENGSLNDVMTTEAPSDAWVVTYEVEGESHRDLARGSRVKLFDMYYDKFKMGIKIIDYGKGTIKPNLWGYQNTQGPKKKKRK
jgi:hypothetical protein